jgi:hypothetical protein
MTGIQDRAGHNRYYRALPLASMRGAGPPNTPTLIKKSRLAARNRRELTRLVDAAEEVEARRS